MSGPEVPVVALPETLSIFWSAQFPNFTTLSGFHFYIYKMSEGNKKNDLRNLFYLPQFTEGGIDLGLS